MPEQEYIKLLYEKKGCSINQISTQMGINWRTAAKYARKDDWNQNCNPRQRRKPIMDAYAEIVDTWLMEDMLKNRKDRQTAAVIYRRLCQEYGFPGKDRTVRQYVANRKRELQAEKEEKYLRLEHQPGEAQVDFGTTRASGKGRSGRSGTWPSLSPIAMPVFAFRCLGRVWSVSSML